tara:strand:- start:468 stop:1031 length:564 start_codon:yes stop_codon:yes gene_type:complete
VGVKAVATVATAVATAVVEVAVGDWDLVAPGASLVAVEPVVVGWAEEDMAGAARVVAVVPVACTMVFLVGGRVAEATVVVRVAAETVAVWAVVDWAAAERVVVGWAAAREVVGLAAVVREAAMVVATAGATAAVVTAAAKEACAQCGERRVCRTGIQSHWAPSFLVRRPAYPQNKESTCQYPTCWQW